MLNYGQCIRDAIHEPVSCTSLSYDSQGVRALLVVPKMSLILIN